MHLRPESAPGSSPEPAGDPNRNPGQRYPEIERLIGNAVCDPSFAELLLHDPRRALHQGGYTARLSVHESRLIVSIHGADNLPEFAARLYQRLQEPETAPSQAETVPG